MTAAEPIAIIGMAGRFPAADGVDEFRDNLFAGMDCIAELADEELIEHGERPDRINAPNYVRRRPILAGADEFDAQLFGMTPREAELRDPQYRLFLETTHAALTHAGYDPFDMTAPVGIYAGTNVNRYRYDYIEERADIVQASGHLAIDIASSPDYLSTFVAYKLGLRGPAMTLLTACSTSLVAVHIACNSIRSGDCDIAVAGGVDIEFPFHRGYTYLPGGIVAADGVPRPFDQTATGTNFGDGAGAVVLKPLSAALAAKDTIYAVIRGSGINNDGDRKVGFTAPSVAGQSECIQRALRAADVDPRTISYVEAHGTATPVGDPIELVALIDAFQAVGGPDLPTQYCAIGSVKSNIGHLGQAAGVAGLIKTALAMRHGVIPPSINCSAPTSAVDWASSPFVVATEPRDWPRTPRAPRRAGISSFGIGGTNAHVILEEAPETDRSVAPGCPEAVLWSALNEQGTETLRERLATHFAGLSEDDFAHTAHTLRAGRTAHPLRSAVLATSAAQAATMLRDPSHIMRSDGMSRSVVFLFPGQGAQRSGMLRGLYAEEPMFKRGCDAAFDVLEPLLGADLRKLWAVPDTDLTATSVAQPLLYTVEYTLAHCLMRWGVRPHALLGHSLGELVAAAVAGVFDFESGLRAVAARALAMRDMPGGSMVAVNAEPGLVTDLVGGATALAAVNGPRQVVLSGPDDSIEEATRILTDRGISVRALHTLQAFHSPAMAEAATRFEAALADLPLREPDMTVVSAATGQPLTTAQATSPAFWASQLLTPVNFDAAATTALSTGSATLVEVGPGRTLSALLRGRQDVRGSGSRVLRMAPPVDAEPESSSLTEVLTRLWVDGEPVTYWRQADDRGYRRVPAPGYPYQRTAYWIDRKAPSDGSAARPVTTPTRVADPAGPVTSDRVAAGPESWSLANLEWRRDRGARQRDDGQRVSLGSALVFCPGESARSVRAAFGRAGYRPVVPDTGEFDPGDSDSWLKSLQRATSGGSRPSVIAHCTLLDLGPSVTSDTHDDQLDRGVHSLIACLRAVARWQRGHRSPTTVVVLGRHLADVSGGEPVNPAAAAAQALLRSAHRELRSIATVCVDVSATTPDAMLADELATLNDPFVALRGTSRWLPQMRRQARATGRPRLRYQGTYLITGGLGGIGLTVAQALADHGLAPRIGLLGRCGMPDPETTAGQRVRVAIKAITDAGADVEIVRGDVTELASLLAAVTVVENRFGPIHGVVHSAGVPGGGLLEGRSRADMQRVLAPKTQGVLAIEDVFADRPELDFLSLFSSQAAITGLFGSADYAAANAFLDAYAQSMSGRERCTRSVQWPGWADVGMAARSDVSLGVLTDAATPAARAKDESAAVTRRFAPGDSWEFDEHVFTGTPVLPGTALLELAVIAAHSEPAYAGRPIELRDTVFLAPVVGAGPIDMRVLLTPVAGVHRFRVQARPEGGEQAWTDHCSGTLTVAEPPRQTGLDAIRERLARNQIAIPDLANWIDFGPRWDTVSQTWGVDGERLARIELPDKFHEDFSAHPMHPAIVDVATGVLSDIEPAKHYAPFLYRRVAVYGPLTGDVTVHTRITSGERRPRPTDMDLYDTDTGQLVVRVEGFTQREVAPGLFGNRATTTSAPPPTPLLAENPSAGLLRPDQGAEVFLGLLTDELPPVVTVELPGAPSWAAGIPWADEGDRAIPTATPVHTVESAVAAPARPAPKAAEDSLIDWLRALWISTLGVADIGLDEDFFDVGGNSLAAVQLISRIQEDHGVDLDVGEIFELTTIRLMADRLRR
jgi:phthiocerol/phenolphthiocerol synthesis type-I polyketide synthase E